MNVRLVNPTEYTLPESMYVVLYGTPLAIAGLFPDLQSASAYAAGLVGATTQTCTIVD